IPLPDEAVDVVYGRQVLHHAGDLKQLVRECVRVLRHGGMFLATREHVADDEAGRAEFLAQHPIHRFTGRENAYPLREYEAALTEGGVELAGVLGPWDSVINAYPAVRSTEELERFPEQWLRARIGPLAVAAVRVPGLGGAARRRIDRPYPGRLYSFLAFR